MDELTPADIQKFLDPFTFAQPRGENAVRKTTKGEVLPEFGESTLLTTNLSQSVNVLRSAYDRLETVLGNLSTSSKLAKEAATSSDSDLRDEAYAKIRSLAAGIDQLVDQSRFNNQRMLDGSPATLVSTLSGGSTVLDLENLLTYGEDSLQLTQLVSTAQVALFFSEASSQLNSNRSGLGIEAISADYVPPEDEADELEDGDYRIQVKYEGAHSTVYLTNQYLEPIATVKDVDLSGDGVETVDFGNGVAITLDKSTAASPPGVDKWDYETRGPVSYYADVFFTKYYQQEMLVNGQEKFVKEAVLKKGAEVATDDGGKLSFGAVSFEGSSLSADALEEGTYTVKVNYFGSNSNVTLRDENGRLVELKSGVDLSQSGANAIEFDNGLVVNIDNDGAGRVPEEFSGTVEVRQASLGTTREASLTKATNDAIYGGGGSLQISSIGNGATPASDDALAVGDYSVEVRYVGKYSMATVRDADGKTVDFVGNLDLSATGAIEMDLGNGISLTIDNEAFSGSGTVKADFSIKEKPRQAQQSGIDIGAKATLLKEGSITGENGKDLSIAKVSTGAVAASEDALEEGDYTIEVTYYGKHSVVSLKDAEGRRLKFDGQLDFEQEGELLVDFHNGLRFTLKNDGFEGFGDQVSASVHYSPAKTGVSATFDFEAYAKQVEEAMDTVVEQMTIIDDTFVLINRQKLLKDQYDQMLNSQNALRGANTIEMLSVGVDSDTAAIFEAGRGNSQAALNIQYILATAGTSQATTFSAVDIVSSAANISENSVFGILNSAAVATNPFAV